MQSLVLYIIGTKYGLPHIHKGSEYQLGLLAALGLLYPPGKVSEQNVSTSDSHTLPSTVQERPALGDDQPLQQEAATKDQSTRSERAYGSNRKRKARNVSPDGSSLAEMPRDIVTDPLCRGSQEKRQRYGTISNQDQVAAIDSHVGSHSENALRPIQNPSRSKEAVGISSNEGNAIQGNQGLAGDNNGSISLNATARGLRIYEKTVAEMADTLFEAALAVSSSASSASPEAENSNANTQIDEPMALDNEPVAHNLKAGGEHSAQVADRPNANADLYLTQQDDEYEEDPESATLNQRLNTIRRILDPNSDLPRVRDDRNFRLRVRPVYGQAAVSRERIGVLLESLSRVIDERWNRDDL